MKAHYTLTPEALRVGAGYHYSHRSKALGMMRVGIGVFLLLIAALQLSQGGGILTVVFIILGFLNLFSKPLWLTRTVKKAFKEDVKELKFKLRANPIGLHLESEASRGTTKWNHFVDYVIKEEGVLLYPQKTLYHWIPKTAEFSEGSWEEFTAKIEKKIEKR